jgi:uncharacterized membrane protein YjjP (DUF1212 family)
LRVNRDGLSPRHRDAVEGFDVVVRVARIALESSGEGVETLERYVARVAEAYRIDVSLMVAFEQAVVTEQVPGRPDRVEVVRSAPGVFRLDKVARLKRVVGRVGHGLPADDACGELDAIAASRPIWPAGVRVLGVALFAAGFAPSIVASAGEVLASLLLGLLMGVFVVVGTGRAVEGLVPVVGAFAVTVVGVLLLPDLAARGGIALMVLPALFVVIPGDTLSAAIAELLTGRVTTGSARLVFATFVLGLVVVGLLAGVGVTGRADLLQEQLPPPELPVLAVLAGWVVFSVGLVLAFCGELVMLLWLVPSVLLTYVLQQATTRGVGAVAGTVLAGVALGAFANLVSARYDRPPRLLLILGGFFVLTVGGVGVRGVTALVGGDVVSGFQDLVDFGVQVPTVAVSLAIGALLTQRWRSRAMA